MSSHKSSLVGESASPGLVPILGSCGDILEARERAGRVCGEPW
jgi:hypothetical protein